MNTSIPFPAAGLALLALLFASLPFLPRAAAAAEPILCGVRPKTEAADEGGKKTSSAPGYAAFRDRIAALTLQERAALLFLVNNGTEEDLIAIPGIARARAATILGARPIFELDDLVDLPGFGPGIAKLVLAHSEVAMR